MSDLFRNRVSDSRIEQADKDLRAILEQSLKNFLDRDLAVSSSGPYAFDYKEVKALFPGEIVLCTFVCSDGAQGKLRFAIDKASAGVLGDVLNMGDGSGEFSQEQHTEPLRDLFKEVVSSFKSEIAKQTDRHLAFDEVKIVVMDLTPNDFSGESWTVAAHEFSVKDKHRIVTIVSNELYESVFPHHGESADTEDSADGGVDVGGLNSSVREEIGLVLDIELPISIELGRTRMLIRDIVKLSPGSVVELNKLSGEPVDLYVNNKRFARGEVVVVDENFAVRLTELATPAERLAVSQN